MAIVYRVVGFIKSWNQGSGSPEIYMAHISMQALVHAGDLRIDTTSMLQNIGTTLQVTLDPLA